MFDLEIEYPVVTKRGTILGYAVNEPDADAIFAYHFPRSATHTELVLDYLDTPVSGRGFTFHKGWVEQ